MFKILSELLNLIGFSPNASRSKIQRNGHCDFPLEYSERFVKDILPFIKESHGVIQRTLYKKFNSIPKEKLSMGIYALTKAGVIKREKLRGTYRLFLNEELHTVCELEDKAWEWEERRRIQKDSWYTERIKTKIIADDILRCQLEEYLGAQKLKEIKEQYLKCLVKVKLCEYPRVPGFYDCVVTGNEEIDRQEIENEFLKYLKKLGNGIVCKFDSKLQSIIDKYWTNRCTKEFKEFFDKYGFLASKAFCDYRLKKILGEETYKQFLNELEVAKQELDIEYCGIEAAGFQHYYIPYLYADSLRFRLNIKPSITIKKCQFCQKLFIAEDIAEACCQYSYPIQTTIAEVEFCNNCFKTAYYQKKDSTKEELAKYLQQLADIVGFIPPKNFGGSNREYLKHLSLEKFKEATMLLNKMPPYELTYNPNNILTYKNAFGAWFNVLVQCKILKKPYLRMKLGTICLAKDGHQCLSLAEKRVDDWLSDQKIQHVKEVHYPEDSEINPFGLLRTDWKIGNIFVELWGLKGNQEYDDKIALKRDLCEKKGLTLVELTLDKLWEGLAKIKELLSNSQIAG